MGLTRSSKCSICIAVIIAIVVASIVIGVAHGQPFVATAAIVIVADPTGGLVVAIVAVVIVTAVAATVDACVLRPHSPLLLTTAATRRLC